MTVHLHGNQMAILLMNLLNLDIANVELLLLEKVKNTAIHIIIDISNCLEFTIIFYLTLFDQKLMSLNITISIMLKYQFCVLKIFEIKLGER